MWGPGGVGGDYMTASSYEGSHSPDKAELNSATGHFRSKGPLIIGDYLQVSQISFAGSPLSKVTLII